jgi:hypothetical protein
MKSFSNQKINIGTTLISIGMLILVVSFNLYPQKFVIPIISLVILYTGVGIIVRERLKSKNYKALITPALGVLVVVLIAIIYRFVIYKPF